MMILTALAHPGHGVTDGFSFTHYIGEPLHAVGAFVVLALGVGAVVVASRLLGRSSVR